MFKQLFLTVKQVFSIFVNRDEKDYDYLADLERKAQAQEKSYLEEKSDFLDEHSQDERENRLFLSRVLTVQEMMSLRRQEELKRMKANCRFSRPKWKSLKRKQLQKQVSLYIKLNNQKCR